MKNISAQQLKHTTVYRGGRTAKALSHETTNVRLEVIGPTRGTETEPAIRFFFSIDSKGGGKTQIFVDVKEGDFVSLIGTMVLAAPTASLPAMAAAVSEHLSGQSKHDEGTRSRAWEALVSKAQKNHDLAPPDRNDVERLVLKAVAKLVAELREAEAARDNGTAAE